MALRKEKHMYPAVCEWLMNILRSKYKRAEVHVIRCVWISWCMAPLLACVFWSRL